MTTLELLARLRGLNIKLWAEGDRLRFQAPKGALTDELRAALAEHKAAVLALLQDASTATQAEPTPIQPVAHDGPLPLSFAQQRLWFLDQLEPGNPFYNLPSAIRLTGQLDRAALQRSLDTIVVRHATLRTTFATQAQQPVQVIAPPAPITIPVVDLGHLPTEEREAAAQQLARAEAQAPFDLQHGPLLRVQLLQLAATDYLVLFTMHHIISDGWSIGILIRELALLYRAFIADQPAPLPELPIQYADYAVWQRQWLRDQALEQQLSYWQKQLHGANDVLELPTDRPRPPRQTFRGTTLTFQLPQALTQALTTLSQREGATLFMTLLAAWQTLLYRYTGQTDIVIGSPIAGRTRQELEGLIGFFVNTLVLRTDLSGNPSFNELLARVRQATLGAFAHQDLPFERLVEALRPTRDMSRSPLFQVAFMLQNAPMAALELSGLTLQPIAVDSGTSMFDLSLSIAEGPDGLAGIVEYNTDLFDAMTIVRMMGHYHTLLDGIVAQPNGRIAQLPLLTAAERQELLLEWNATAVPYPAERCLHELLEDHAVQRPDADAVICEDRRLSYRQLNERANQLAHYLRRLGVGPETLVGLCTERSPEMVIGMLGVLKAGAAYVPLDPAYPAERLDYMLRDSQVPVLLTQQALRERLALHPARIVCLDSEWPMIAAEATDTPRSGVTVDHLAYIIYTSGSTGRPKGTLVSHRGLCNLAMAQIETFGLSADDRVLQFASLSFDASLFEIIKALGPGATLCLPSPGIPPLGSALYQFLHDAGITAATLAPSALSMVPTEALPALRVLCVAGEACPPSLIAAWAPGRRFFNLYGPTEATIWTTAAECTDSSRPPAIGRPIANTHVYVLDAQLQPVPVGVPGELYIGGVGLGRGYLNRPDLAADRFVPNPFAYPEGSRAGERLYKTGDLVRYRPDGNLEFLGRIDHQVKLRGFRIELGEIEAVLARYPGVREVVVVAREDQAGDSRLVAYVVGENPEPRTQNLEAAPDSPPSPAAGAGGRGVRATTEGLGSAELRQHLHAHLPDYMVPSTFVLLEALPLTPNGKVDRQALPAPDGARPTLETVFVAPRTATEVTLASLWAAVLGTAQVGVHDNFFELGGHSLLATQLVSRVRDTFQVELPLREIFAAPTVAELALRLEIVDDDHTLTDAPLVPVERDGPLPLSFSQERLWFLDQFEPNSSLYNIPTVLRITGRLDLPAFERSLTTLIARHEILRTTFMAVDGRPRQVIATPTAVTVPVVDLRQLPVEERETTARTLVQQEALQPFDLQRGPLLRVRLFQLTEADAIVVTMLHHSISDGWSTGVLVTEVGDLYRAYVQGTAPTLPALPLQYADYAVWQRQWLQGDVLDRQLRYWTTQLGSAHPQGAVPLLDLPTDHPRPAVQSFSGTRHSFTLPESLVDGLQALSQREGVTLFMTLLAAFNVLLQRYSSQDDIAVGTPIAGRTRREIEPLIGCFINTLVLRTDLSGTPTFRELLQRVRQVTLGAYEHQDVPFELLVETLQPTRQLSYNPLFQVLFVLQNAPLPALEMPDAEFSVINLELAAAKNDLALEFIPVGTTLSANFEYNTDLFERSTIERLQAHLVLLLDGIVADPAQRIARLPLLTDAERATFAQWNAATLPVPPAPSIQALVEQQVARTPDAVAVIAGTDHLTYAALNARANQLAHALRERGVGPEVCVGLCMARSVELLVGLLGILKAGGAYVPLDPAYPAERLHFMLDNAQAPLLLTAGESAQDQPAVVPQFQGARLDLVDAGPTIARYPTHNPVPVTTPQQLAYLIYTSGSTGRPKGVAIPHASAVGFLAWAHTAFTAEQLAGVLAATSIGFDLSVFEICAPLSAGGTIILADNALSLPTLPAADQVTLINTVPSVLTALLRTSALPSAVRTVNLAGEPLPLALVQQLYATTAVTAVYNLYGPSEDTTYSTYTLVAPDAAFVPIGRPLPNTQAYVLDAQGQLTPIGVPGELYLGGQGLARGYFNRPDLTAERFVPDPFSDQPSARLYKTGDLVRYRPDGQLEYLGRLDHQVKLRGFRIELGEIEAVLARYPGVREVVVMARADQAGEPLLVAYLACSVVPPPTVNLLRQHLHAQLPDYMVPSAFVLLEALPLTPNGKVDRQALPAPDSARPELAQAFVAPRTATEATLVALWREVLGTTQIGVHDNFFELGGHSLLATQLVSRVRDTFQVELPLREIFAAPTIEALATCVETLDATKHPAADVPPLVLVERDRPLPLSFSQERLWFLDQFEPNSSLYNIPTVLRITGRLDLPAFERSLTTLLARHEILRTTFRVGDGQLMQVIATPTAVTVPVVDLCQLPAEEREATARTLVQQEALQPFDLQRGPLLRVRVFQLAEADAIVVTTLHHSISDGWSTGVLVTEVGELYRAYVQGTAPTLPALPLQYADYVVWQRSWLQGPVLDRQLRYWTYQLGGDHPRGAVPLLDLPTDRPRPAVQTFDGQALTFTLPQALSAGLSTVSQREGVTLFMTLLAAFNVLLQRYSGQDDIAVGTPIANRTRREIEPLIGCFINTLVLRTDLSGTPTFRELLGRVQQVTLGAYEHQDVPFELLVDRLQPTRQLSYNPLFQVLFVLQNTPLPALELPDVQFRLVDPELATAKTDLTLEIVPVGANLVGSLTYNTALFDHNTIERLLGHFVLLLEGIVADPALSIDRLPLLTKPEEQQILVEWNDTAALYAQDQCLHDLFVAQAERSPQALAVSCGDQQLSYGELHQRSNQLAHYLRRLGVTPETRVGLCLDRSLDLVIALLGILKAGGAYVPLDPAYPAERLHWLVQDAQLALVLTQAALYERLPGDSASLVVLDDDSERIAEEPTAALEKLALPDTLAYVIYTSGSTGRPKGVMVTHRSIVNHLQWRQAVYPLDSSDRFLHKASFSFDISVWECFAPWLAGGCLELVPSEIQASPAEMADLIARKQVTVFHAGPALLHMLLEQPALAGYRQARHVFSGGESLTRTLRDRCFAYLPAAELHHQYGPTEACVDATIWTCQRGVDETIIPIGRPIANMQSYILDAQGAPVPVGVTGEVYLGGVGVARGYLNRPDLTAEKFLPDPFSDQPSARLYRTGDLARYRVDGAIEFVGRVDHQVKLRGYRIELGEIESTLRQYPGVQEAVVVTRQDRADMRLVAYVVGANLEPRTQNIEAAPDSPPSLAAGAGGRGVRATTEGLGSAELRAFLAQRLPDYMVPSAFVVLDALPLTPNGKVDRQALPAPDGARPELETAFAAPRSATEATLVALWSGVLGTTQVGVHDNFFELGGHSLLATQLVSRVRDTFQVELPLREIFAAPTVAGLAVRIDSLDASAQPLEDVPPLVPVDRRDPLPLSFSQERLWFLNQFEPNSSLYNIPSVLRITGRLDRSAFSRSLTTLIARHEILRTTFTVVDNQPVQVIAPPMPLDVPVVDLRDLPPAEREATARTLAQQEALQPFDLQRGPLLRVRLLQLAEAEALVVTTLHHSISDGWSTGVLVAEVGQLYRAYVQGSEPLLPALAIQYADYAVWQRQWLSGPVLDRQLRYWTYQLGGDHPQGAVPLLDLPTDRPRPAVQTFDGQALTFTLSASLVDGLQALSQREGVTLFMTLLAAFNVLLQRYSGQADIAVGTPIANRTRREIEPLIGCFINTLVLRTDLSGTPTFRELLQRVQQVTLGAYEHQDVPFEMLVDRLQPTRQLSYNPLFQVLFALQNTPMAPLVLPDAEFSLVDLELATAKTDLALEFMPVGGTLVGSLAYNTALFDHHTIERLQAHLLTLLDGIVADPALPIDRLPLLTAAEEQQLLVEWNATAGSYPDDRCIHQLFEAQVARTPDAVALVCAAERMSYAELNRRANQIAHYLRRIGVGPGVRVGLCFQRSIEDIVGLLGVLKAGAAYVPLDPAYPAERLAFMLDDARLPVLLSQTGLGTELPEDRTRVVYLDRDWATIAREPSDNLVNLATPDDLAYTIYTSGSTGQPKGASVYQRGVINLLHWFTGEFAISAEDRALVITSLSFDLTQKNLFAPLIVGGQLHLFASDLYDVELITQQIAEHSITLLNCTPSAFYPLAEHGGNPARNRLASLRYVFLGGEPIAVARLETWAAAPQCQTQLVNTYGPTECTDISSFYRVDHLERFRDAPIPIGYPITNFSLFVLDRQQQPVPVGVVGELYIGGIGVGQGYLNRPELTAEKFVPHPFTSDEPGARLYRTGDLVRYQPDGAIEFLGRIDHQVKVRGFRIELGEIEAVLREYSALRDAVVLVREDTPGNQRIVAYVTEEPRTKNLEPRIGEQRGTDFPPSPTAVGEGGRGVRATTEGPLSNLRAYLAERLPDYMVPSAFVVLDVLPLTPNGKVDRKALPVPDAARLESERVHVAPRTRLEQLIADMWSEHFQVERVGIHDSFFELGGNSIQGAVFINRLQDLLGEYVSVIALFEAPNVADLATYLVKHHGAALVRAGLSIAADQNQVERLESSNGHSQLSQILPVPRDESVLLPLSFAQQRLWFLDQLEPNSPLYSIPTSVRLRGRLDRDALQRSLDALIQRHESLRTTFNAVEGQPVQVIALVAQIALVTVDLHDLPSAERATAAQQLAQQEALRPFDLQRGPLMRATLALLDTDEHLLVLTLHHIITDGWSMGVLIGELAASYRALVGAQSLNLPVLPIQYADFAVWQRQWFQGPVLAQQLDYWKQQLHGVPAALDLPTDRPRPAVQSFRGAATAFHLPLPLTQKLQALSQRQGVTLFMTLLAAWQTLLFRITGQDDISVGSPIANRTRQELEGLIGFFVNTLVLRTDLSGDPTFTELLSRVRQTTVGAFAHQDLPFEYLVDAIQPERDLSRSPLFQVMLVLQNTPSEPLRLPDLTLETVDTHSGTAKFDLLLALVEQPDGLGGAIEYPTDLFDADTITRLVDHFETLLNGIVANPAQPLSRLPLLTTDEHQLLVDWNSTAAPYPTLAAHQLVEAQAARTPEVVAVVFGDHHLTYAELHARANQLAHHLRTLGVGPDVPVGLCLTRSLELVVGMLGILKAGGAYVPLDPHYPAERLALMLADAQAPVVVTAPTSEADPRALLHERFAGTLVDLIGDEPQIREQPTHAPGVAVELDHLAYVIYTSGSTGIPKGVAMPHRPLANMIAWQQREIPGAARTLQFASPSFDVSFQEIFSTWASGGTLVLPPESLRRDPEALAVFLDAQRIERLFLPFVALQQLAEAIAATGHTPAYLREVITAGEQLQITPAIAAWFAASPHTRLHNHYGPSETHVVTAHTLTGDPAQWPALPPIGTPIANTQAYVLDRSNQPLPIGAIGDLYFGGDCLARGYLHRPDLTAERFVMRPLVGSSEPMRLYRTGDLARYRANGVLEFLGRADAQVKVRGYRVEPGEIEHVLAQHPAVREAVVVVRSTAADVAQLVAYVVASAPEPTADDDAALLSTLRSFLQERLPDYLVPSALMVLERWPLTPSGKVDRRALPAPDVRASGSGDTFVAPRDTLEIRLVSIWEDLLGVRPVGIRDSFFALGGHSLLVVRLMAQIGAQLGQKLPLATLFQEPTVEHLARTLRQVGTMPLDTPLIPLQPGGTQRPFFCVHPGGGSVLSYLALARLLGPDQPFYGLQAAGLEGEQPPRTEVEAMATAYLAALRVVQPEGPYLLGGWSFGGLVAYEMACQLTAQGEDVALLALFDSWAPSGEAAPPVDETTLLLWFATDLGRTLGADLRVSAETLADVAPEARWETVLELARASGQLPSDLGERELRAYLDVFTANLHAMHTYRPRPYAGRVTLFRAGEQPLGDRLETLGWETLAADGVQLHVLPADHYTLVRPPHVETLAEALQAELEAATTQDTAPATNEG